MHWLRFFSRLKSSFNSHLKCSVTVALISFVKYPGWVLLIPMWIWPFQLINWLLTIILTMSGMFTKIRIDGQKHQNCRPRQTNIAYWHQVQLLHRSKLMLLICTIGQIIPQSFLIHWLLEAMWQSRTLLQTFHKQKDPIKYWKDLTLARHHQLEFGEGSQMFLTMNYWKTLLALILVSVRC